MGKKKFKGIEPRAFAICHRQAAKQGIQKDSITGTSERKKFVESCILDMKRKGKIKKIK